MPASPFFSNKKVRRLALKSVLSDKAAQEKIIVVDSIAMGEIKTKAFYFLSAALAMERSVMMGRMMTS